MKIMNTAVFALAAIVALGAAGCSSSKELNERSGRALLSKAMANAYFPIPISDIVPLMQRTRVDYDNVGALKSRLTPAAYQRANIITKLLNEKLAVKHEDKVSYPNIHGSFLKTSVTRGCTPPCFDRYDLGMSPNSNQITGSRTQQRMYERGHLHWNVTGEVDPDGKVTIHWQTPPWTQQERYQYSVQGSTAWLTDLGNIIILQDGPKYRGTAAGRVEVSWYSYSFSPEMETQIVREGARQVVKGGSYEVGEVSDLQLVTDTQATASFTWRASLNRFGRPFWTVNPSGKGRVAFGKKPDGTWFVSNWCTVNCLF